MSLFFKRFWTLFSLLFTTSFPINFDSWLNFPAHIAGLWEWFYSFWSSCFNIVNSPILSDTKGLFLHVTFLLIISFIIAFIWNYQKPIENIERNHYFNSFVTYYLSLQLIIYGFNKLFLMQFPSPTANLLYTNLGKLSKDILFWVSISSSPLYNYFTGGLELLTGALLLHYRTRVIGSLLAIVVFTSVVLINFSFDISVKLYSSFLLLTSLYIAAPYIPSLINFFLKNKLEQLTIWKTEHNTKRKRTKAKLLKLALVISFFTIGIHPYLITLNKENKTVVDLGFSEAYEIVNENNLNWKRIFIHPKSYFIVENTKEEFLDFKLVIALNNNQFIVNDKNVLNFKQLTKGKIKLTGLWNKSPVSLVLKPISNENLPLVKAQFHWTID